MSEDEPLEEDEALATGAAFLIALAAVYALWRALTWVVGHFAANPGYAIGKIVGMFVGTLVVFTVASWVTGKIIIAIKHNVDPWVGGEDE